MGGPRSLLKAAYEVDKLLTVGFFSYLRKFEINFGFIKLP
jgi:hypothetical protein